MSMRALTASLMTMVVALALSLQVLATPTSQVSGVVSPVTDLGEVIRVADGNVFYHHHDTHYLTGSFVGSAAESGTIVLNPSTGRGVAFAFLVFTGSVGGAEGTFIFEIDGTISLPSIKGRWVVFGGTGGLAGIHGEGTFYFANAFGEGTYSGENHFDP